MLALALLYLISLVSIANGSCSFPVEDDGNCSDNISEDNWSVNFDEDSSNPATVYVTLAATSSGNYRLDWSLGSGYEIDVNSGSNDYSISIQQQGNNYHYNGASSPSVLMVFLLAALTTLGFQSPSKRSSLLLVGLLVVLLPIASNDDTLDLTITIPTSVLDDGNFEITFTPSGSITVYEDSSISGYLTEGSCSTSSNDCYRLVVQDGCNANEYLSGSTCVACSGGSNYNCGAGSYKTGTACTGSGTSDTQTCASCTGGASYSCGAGFYKTGTACSGSGSSDTQTCSSCTGGAGYSCSVGSYKTGTACSGTGTTNTQTCATCGSGGAVYSCGAGSYQTGTACGGSGTTDTQTCATCTGGAVYSCSAGSYKDGSACTGTSTSNTQTCATCNHGGATYTCPAGDTVTGTACTGATTTDTQTCSSDPVPCGGTCTTDQRCVQEVCVGSGILFFTIKWTMAGDVDTYLTTPLGNTISYTNRDADGGTLDVDDTSGTGPENVYWPASGPAPPHGTYLLCAHPYSSSVPLPQTMYYQLNSDVVMTHTLVDTIDTVPDPCTESYPNFLGKLVY